MSCCTSHIRQCSGDGLNANKPPAHNGHQHDGMNGPRKGAQNDQAGCMPVLPTLQCTLMRVHRTLHPPMPAPLHSCNIVVGSIPLMVATMVATDHCQMSLWSSAQLQAPVHPAHGPSICSFQAAPKPHVDKMLCVLRGRSVLRRSASTTSKDTWYHLAQPVLIAWFGIPAHDQASVCKLPTFNLLNVIMPACNAADTLKMEFDTQPPGKTHQCLVGCCTSLAALHKC